jgi:hypothetical protein
MPRLGSDYVLARDTVKEARDISANEALFTVMHGITDKSQSVRDASVRYAAHACRHLDNIENEGNMFLQAV